MRCCFKHFCPDSLHCCSCGYRFRIHINQKTPVWWAERCRVNTRCEAWYLVKTLKKSDIRCSVPNREADKTAAEAGASAPVAKELTGRHCTGWGVVIQLPRRKRQRRLSPELHSTEPADVFCPLNFHATFSKERHRNSDTNWPCTALGQKRYHMSLLFSSHKRRASFFFFLKNSLISYIPIKASFPFPPRSITPNPTLSLRPNSPCTCSRDINQTQ